MRLAASGLLFAAPLTADFFLNDKRPAMDPDDD
jgi:hypothetical protein